MTTLRMMLIISNGCKNCFCMEILMKRSILSNQRVLKFMGKCLWYVNLRKFYMVDAFGM